MITALSSVGGGIATGDDYDVIVRQVDPSKLRSVEAATETPDQ